jgi:hypothetical protein
VTKLLINWTNKYSMAQEVSKEFESAPEIDAADIKKLIERKHPRYMDMLAHWNFLEQCYLGGRDWFNKENIFRYMKEGEEEFKDRLARAYRFNHSREVVDLVNKYLFRGTVNRSDDAPDGLKKFWKSSTLGKLDIDEFMEVASTKSSIFGRSWIIIDSDVVKTETTTIGDLEKFHGPYVYVVRPQDVVDLSFDIYGNLIWILVKEYKRDDEDPFTGTGNIRERYRLWTRELWYLLEGEDVINGTKPTQKPQVNGPKTSIDNKGTYKMIDSGVHGLGIVPAVPNDNSFTMDPYTVPSLIADIAYLDRACANYASNLDAIVQDQTFSQLAMPAQGVMPGEDNYEKMLQMGTKRVFLYDGENGNQPVYLSPDPKQAQLIISAIQTLINEIYHSVGLAGERTKQDNAKGIDNSSGVAKSKDFERVAALLKSKATCLETVECRMAEVVCRWNGETLPEKEVIEYSEDFDIKGLSEEIELVLSVVSLDAPELVLAEKMKGLIKKLFPEMGEVRMKEFLGGADEWAKDQKEKSAIGPEEGTLTGSLLEETKRDRADAGAKQSETKQRDTAARKQAE